MNMKLTSISPKAFEDQIYISEHMRACLCAWMCDVDVSNKTTSYFLAVHIMDRYITVCKDIKKEDFQCVGGFNS